MNSTGKSLEKDTIESYIKSVSKLIVDNIGGTEYGPAASFRDIVRAIVKNSEEILPIASPTKFDGIPNPVFVSVPVKLGKSVGNSIFDTLSAEEKDGIKKAAEAIYQTYISAVSS